VPWLRLLVIGSVTAEDRLRDWDSPCGICGGQSVTGTGFAQGTSVVPVNFTPPVLRYMEKGGKKKLIVFITGFTIGLKVAVRP
jgi:hypothetical protein